MMEEQVFIGIDVAKASLDVAVHPTGQGKRFSNDEEGVNQTVAWLKQLSPELVLEETLS